MDNQVLSSFGMSLKWLDLTCQHDWAMECPDTWSNIILGVPTRVIWIKFTFIYVEWIKQIAFSNVSGLHPITQGLMTTKSDIAQGETSFWWPPNWDINFFPVFRLELTVCSSWVLELLAFRLELYFSWVSSLLTYPSDLGTLSLSNTFSIFVLNCYWTLSMLFNLSACLYLPFPTRL